MMSELDLVKTVGGGSNRRWELTSDYSSLMCQSDYFVMFIQIMCDFYGEVTTFDRTYI